MTESNVKDFYKGKNVFITGGTGFVGVALVEKLLRTTEVNKIYLLVRQKKNKNPAERLEEFKKNKIFLRMIEECGSDVFNKLIPVSGDVGDENLGLSDSDLQLLVDNVNIVFHSAATLDFGANLKTNIQINLMGTRRVVGLCKKITNFVALLHVSSAFVNSHLSKTEEKLYPVHETAEKVIELAEKCTDQELEDKSSDILGKYINAYTFTKALAEIEVTQANSAIPTCIVRPSMIVAAWREPIEGWTNSKNGPQGFIMGAAKGVVRRLPVDENIIADYIPVDVVVNGMIVGAWHAAVTSPSETPIFHLTSSTCKPFRWNLVTPSLHSLLHKYPLKNAVWYPNLKLLPSLLMFKISAIIFHWIPAYILDAFALITGGRTILVRMHTNINNSLERLKPFIFSEWLFDNKKTMALHNSLTTTDKDLFTLDIGPLNWEKYFDSMAQGVRTYLHNESPSSVQSARKKDKILRFLNLLIQAVFVGVIWSLVILITGASYKGTLFIVPLVLFILYVL